MVKGEVGMQVKIIGNRGGHGFKIGEIVQIKHGAYSANPLYGGRWLCRGTDGWKWYVYECDMIPVKAAIL